MRNRYYHIRPDVFIKESLSLMQGYPKLKVWLYMPIAYIKIVWLTIKNK